MKLTVFLFWLMLLVVTPVAAQSATPTPIGSWSYTFNFDESDYCFNIIQGDYGFQDYVGGNGILFTDFNEEFQSYILQASLGLPIDVYPTYAYAVFDMVDPDTGDAVLSGNGYVFGISQAVSAVALEADVWGITFSPAYAGTHGDSINLAFQVFADPNELPEGARPALRTLTIGGQGLNPFENFDPRCVDGATLTPLPSSTPTPTQPTPTRTYSPTPSDTPTPTLTTSPTPTATLTPTSSPTPTSYCETVDFDGEDDLDWYFYFDDNDLDTGFTGQAAHAVGQTHESGYYQNNLGVIVDVSNLVNITSVQWKVKSAPGGDIGGSYVHLSVGTDENPEIGIAEGSYGISGYPHRDNLWYDAIVTSGLSPYPRLSFLNYWSSTTLNEQWIDEIVICHTGYVATPSLTPTVTTTNTTIPPSSTRTPNPFATPTLTPPPLSPGTPSPSPTASRTRAPIYVPPTYTLPPLGTFPPSVTPFATSTSVYTATPSLTPELTATPGLGFDPNPIFVPWDGGSPDDGGDILQVGGAFVDAGQNAMNQAFAYLDTFKTTFTGITDAWSSAVPIALPGMPLCRSNPRLSELCAIYYILRYTILSGVVGTLIIPTATAVVYLVVILTFIQLTRAVLARLGEISKS